MIKEIVARRYARALFQVIHPGQSDVGARADEIKRLAEPEARLREELDQTRKTLEAVGQAVKRHAYFRHLMLNPRFNRETKIRVLKVLLEKMQAGEPVVKFFEHLVRKNRFQYLEEVGRAFATLVDELQGVIMVPISTARELSGADQEAVRRGIESVTGRTVQIQWSVNPSLIGGMVAQVGEAMVDGSILGQLQAFRRVLVEA